MELVRPLAGRADGFVRRLIERHKANRIYTVDLERALPGLPESLQWYARAYPVEFGQFERLIAEIIGEVSGWTLELRVEVSRHYWPEWHLDPGSDWYTLITPLLGEGTEFTRLWHEEPYCIADSEIEQVSVGEILRVDPMQLIHRSPPGIAPRVVLFLSHGMPLSGRGWAEW